MVKVRGKRENQRILQLRRYNMLLGFVTRTFFFVFLSIVDLAFTLFHFYNKSLDEANPIADVALQFGGPLGLCSYKVFFTSVVIAAVAIIYIKKRRTTACRVLNLAVAISGFVAVYHVLLVI